VNRKILLVSLAALFMVPAFTTLYFDSFEWAFENTEIPLSVGAESVWAANDSDVWAVAGIVIAWNGANWQPMSSNTSEVLIDVWGSGPSDIFAVGGGGTIIHFDGVSWERMPTDTDVQFQAVSGTGPDDVWAVGPYGEIHHYDGIEWTKVESGSETTLFGVHATAPNEVFAVGEQATILRYDGDTWEPMKTPTFGRLRKQRLRSRPGRSHPRARALKALRNNRPRSHLVSALLLGAVICRSERRWVATAP